MGEDPSTAPEISRRKALKRGVIIGAAVWTPPVVASFRMPAAGRVGSPAPTPSPSETPTPPPDEATPTPTPTSTSTPPASPTPTATPDVGGVTLVSDTDVAGAGLAKTGQALTAPTAAGIALTAVGAGMRAAARKRTADAAGVEDLPPAEK